MRKGEISFGSSVCEILSKLVSSPSTLPSLPTSVAPTETNPGTVSSFSISPTMMVLLPCGMAFIETMRTRGASTFCAPQSSLAPRVITFQRR